jgi:hypothetical protein
MRIRLFVLFLGLLCVAGRANAQDSPENYHLEVGVMFWKPAPEILISSGTQATTIDLINQFAIEKERVREFRVVLKASQKHKIRFSTVPIDYTGNATLNQTIVFRGQTYTVGVPTTAELKWTLMRIGYEWDPIATNMGFVGLFTDVKYNKMTATLSAPAPIGTQTFERNVPVPTIGGIARGYLAKYVSVTGEFTALKLNKSSFNAKFYDFDLYGTANFGQYVGAQFGYRSVTVDYVIDDDTGNLKMKGPYFGGVLRF